MNLSTAVGIREARASSIHVTDSEVVVEREDRWRKKLKECRKTLNPGLLVELKPIPDWWDEEE